ncbi:uncharacterized protein Obp47b isoform X2 [Eurosta solidaginis]|uniref:uncharacterized protein Obp47b isoform X2 n=1 Tax=Eurosta solidaginis TaxID=178769 RepID=UPI00353174B0
MQFKFIVANLYRYDPTLCCKNGGRDQSIESCAQRMGMMDQGNNAPPTMETATCFAECILKQLKYMEEPEKLNFESIQTQLQSKHSNDTVYVDTMMNAYHSCEPVVHEKIKILQKIPLGGAAAFRRGCSPFSGMMLGCTYMEYFKNCPAHHWTENEQCALAKRFVTQCSLGA